MLTESRQRRRGSIKGAIALLKVASEADKAAKGGDAAAALAALTNYREAVDALDPAGEAVAALFANPEAARVRGEAGRLALAEHRGSVERSLALIEAALADEAG